VPQGVVHVEGVPSATAATLPTKDAAMPATAKDPSRHIRDQHDRLLGTLPFDDIDDFAAADRGFVGAREPNAVRAADGRVVWDNDTYDFVSGDAPDTVNPSLWRQSSLVARQGLYEVTDGIYQVRGMDLSNITFVEGDTGVIVVDPLISKETAAAAMELYRAHRGDRPVTGMIYTHSHIDHFGGSRGILGDDHGVPVLAPAGFMDHAIEENVFAGVAMGRRAGYMYGAVLDRDPRGQVGAGLGQTTSTGEATLVPPSVDVTRTGQVETIDGVRMEFQLAPGTEAPSEMHFLFPDRDALCIAENATHNLHNLLTLRGALVRDPHIWAHHLTEAIDLFADRADVVFASHHWPTWGRDQVHRFLSLQRDLYAYVHDQTLRMMNLGLTGIEIAEAFQLPPALEQAWHAHGYYGSISHNVKAVYQRYMGWYDGNPANLWRHVPAEAGKRYLEFMGGADAVVAKARDSFDAGDYRWVAEVVNHVIQVDPDHAAAKELLADTYEQLAYGAENGTWRCEYLSATHELREGTFGTPTNTAAPDLIGQLTPEQLLDSIAIRVNAPACWDDRISLDLDIDGTMHRVTLRNGVLVHTSRPQATKADVTVTTSMEALLDVAIGQLGGFDGQVDMSRMHVDGDAGQLQRLVDVLQQPDPDFPILTPARAG
jgi:alkyl sulfatase BDS1-like metallo-beta-lactamase superfamily hydrolase